MDTATSLDPRAAARLTVQPSIAKAVLRQVQKADDSNAILSRLVEYDPALAATALRLANAPLFGLAGRVGTITQSVMLLGANTIGALAVSGTASLVLSDDWNAAPPGYWRHSLTTAVAASTVAKLCGASPHEAFTAGLLHEIAALVSPEAGDDRLHTEFCLTSRTSIVSAKVLSEWGLPRALVSAVRKHQALGHAVKEPLAIALVAGHALACSNDGTTSDHTPNPAEQFGVLLLPTAKIEQLNRSIAARLDAIATEIEDAAR